jgi:hypothetical protein
MFCAMVAASGALPGVAARAAVCEYLGPLPPKPSAKEQALQDAIQSRRSWGMRHGRAYVRRVNADPASRRRATLEIGFPVTRREAAYFRARFRLQDDRFTRRMDAYMRRHRDDFGAVSIEDDYPRAPYLLVRIKNHVARHRAAIDRRFALRFEVKPVAHSERDLRRIQRSIDWDELGAQGIEVVSTGLDGDRVLLHVTTQREDAAAVVRGLYGRAVKLTVLGPTPTHLACSAPRRYRVDPDGRTITASYVHSGSIEPRHIEVIESATEVQLGMVSEVPYGFLTGDAVRYELTATLAEPLGDRSVTTIQRRVPVRRET